VDIAYFIPGFIFALPKKAQNFEDTMLKFI
jgi:hypothetical protein